MRTGLLWKEGSVYLDPATILSMWITGNGDLKAGIKFWHFASWEQQVVFMESTEPCVLAEWK